jgi:ubiquinone biosynthesis protein COQ4
MRVAKAGRALDNLPHAPGRKHGQPSAMEVPMAAATTHELSFDERTGDEFDPRPLPHRPIQWLRAARAMARIQQGFDNMAALDFALALEGDDGERSFQQFLGEPGAEDLLRERPRLEQLLDDFAALAKLPDGSLGRAYLALAERDDIRVTGLVDANQAQPDEPERAPDPVRRWFRSRMTASHDLLHVLTGYERDRPGELLLLAFSHAIAAKTVFRVSLSLGAFAVPWRHKLAFPIDLVRAYRRGRATNIPRATPWEELLALPIDEARTRLGIASKAATHRGRGWHEEADGGPWRRVSLGESAARA